jgi:hypothetical protein
MTTPQEESVKQHPLFLSCPLEKNHPGADQRHAALNGEALLRCKWNRLAVRFIPGMVLLLASKHAAADSGLFVSASTSEISAVGLLIGLCFLSTLYGLRLLFRSTTAKPMQ